MSSRDSLVSFQHAHIYTDKEQKVDGKTTDHPARGKG
jgi:hypothetical protein